MLQEANIHLNRSRPNDNMAIFLSTNLQRSLSKSDSTIRLLHKTNHQHAPPSLLFPLAEINYFGALYIGSVKLSTIHYSENKRADDSNIIFKLNHVTTFGRICSIFTVQNSPPLLAVDYLVKTEPLRCNISYSNNYFCYPHIRHGDSSSAKTCVIQSSDFIEKCVLFQSSNNIGHFFRFPTLHHAS